MRKGICTWTVLLLASTVVSLLAGEPPQHLAIVNVSRVFENYKKVPDIQRRMDAIFQKRRDALELRSRELGQRNRELEQLYGSGHTTSEAVFDAVQKLRKDQFVFERDLNALNEEASKDYAKDMRRVLSEIRQAVRTVAEKGKFDMVLRSPDADDPNPAPTSATNDPAASDKYTFESLKTAQSTLELIERFNRNPVLFGAQTVDITNEVLTKLNNDYDRMIKTPLPAK